MRLAVLLLCTFLVALGSAKTFYREDFGDDWKSKWVVSHAKDEDGTGGIWKYECGRFCASDAEKGLRTGEDSRFYQISSKFEPFSNADTDMVVTYTVKNEQHIDCGGWYIKLGSPGMKQEEFNGETDYNIMIGPDVCGANKRIHFILNHDGKNHLISDEKAGLGDPERETEKVHAYTFVLKKDKTYAVFVDGMKRGEGAIEDHWSILAPKNIPDPAAKKPADWDDNPKIADPSVTKPENWDQPAEIQNPNAKKPADWDDDVDGEWQAPMMKNPKYKGEWKAPQIDNPNYKGEWVHPTVPNPDYKPDPSLAVYTFGWAGIDLWQVKSGSIFTHIWIGDDLKEQLDWVRGPLKAIREKEGAVQAEQQAKDAEEARRRMEEEQYEFVDDDDDHDEL